MNVRDLKIEQRHEATGLLKSFDLVYTDLKQENIRIFKFEETDKLLGIGGLEIYGELALLRTVAVEKESQGKKAGRFICEWIENWAKENQISELYLLTTTAKDFFTHLNYQVMPRNEFPELLRKTSQFSKLCPVSAVCMKKIL
jgi:amino-acid N-acetyltransferase